MPTQWKAQYVLPGYCSNPGILWSDDGAVLASLAGDREIQLWDAASSKPLQSLTAPEPISAGWAFSRDGCRLAAGLSSGRIGLWDCRSGSALPVHSDAVFAAAVISWSPDRWSLASASPDSVSIWNCYTGRPKLVLGRPRDAVCIRWSRDSQILAVADTLPAIKLWNAVRGGLHKMISAPTAGTFALAWSPDGKYLASGGGDTNVYIWEVDTRKICRVLEGHTDAVVALDYAWDGKCLASKSLDGTLRIWFLGGSNEEPVVNLEGARRNDCFATLAFHPHAYALASVDCPGDRVRIRVMESGPIKSAKLTSDARESTREVLQEEVFVSYAWTDASNAIVDSIQKTLEERGVVLVRDRSEMRYKDSIQAFMKRIGRGKCIIVILSKAYLESKSCMFELTQIAARKNIRDRVFPIVLEDANVYDAVGRLDYIRYWEKKKEELDSKAKTVGGENVSGIQEEINLFARIRATIDRIVSILADMNALTPEQHQGSKFENLLHALRVRLSE